jgi:ribosomal protein S18 acetylase RimI-like enzyme
MQLTTAQFETSAVGAPVERVASKRDGSRRLQMLKRSGLFGRNTLGALVERAWQLTEFRDAFKLVHDSFVAAGYIKPTPSGMRIRPYDALPEMATFVAFSEQFDRTIGVLSVLADQTALGLPGDQAFSAEIASLRRAGAKLCEVTNQAVAPGFRKTGVCTELMRAGMAHALAAGCNTAIAIVSPSHAAAYRLLGFQQIGTVRSYSLTANDPVVALWLDIDQFRIQKIHQDPADAFVRDFMATDNPYHRKIATWERQAQSFFSHPRVLRKLFVTEERLLQRCTTSQLLAIHDSWGAQVFSEVLGTCNLNLFEDSTPPVPMCA